MLKEKSLIVFILILVLGVSFISCKNSWMSDWWPEETIPVIIVPVKPVGPSGGSGDNFAVVVFDADGGTPQPKSVKVAWGETVGRLRPISRETYGFLGWFDENGGQWDVETRIVTKFDVNSDGFIVLTARWQQSPSLIYTVNFIADPDLILYF